MEWVETTLHSSDNFNADPLTVFSQSLTYDVIKELTEDINRTAVASNALEQLDKTSFEKDFDTLQAALVELQAGQNTEIYRNFQAIRKESLQWIDNHQGQHPIINSLLEKVGKPFTNVSNNQAEDVELPGDCVQEVINRYQRVIDNPSASRYTKMLFSEMLSLAYKEEGDKLQSGKLADKAVSLATDIWGADSEELQALKERLCDPI